MKVLLTSVIIASFFFALLSFILSRKKKWALIGIVICTASIVIGGFNVQGRSVEKTAWHLGLDWLLLDLLLMAVIFIPIEMVMPKRKEQPRFHEEWRTDLVYFCDQSFVCTVLWRNYPKACNTFFWLDGVIGPAHMGTVIAIIN
jgi:lathosterol oxidase